MGAADIFKCHDQVSRRLAITLSLMAGLPKGVARAYTAFHSQASYVNVLAQGVATPIATPGASRNDAPSQPSGWLSLHGFGCRPCWQRASALVPWQTTGSARPREIRPRKGVAPPWMPPTSLSNAWGRGCRHPSA